VKDKTQLIMNELQELMLKVRDEEDNSYHTAAVLFMGGMLFISLLILYIKSGYTHTLASFLFVLFTLSIYYIIQNGAIQDFLAEDLAYREHDEESTVVKGDTNNLLKLFRLQKAKLSAVKTFYIFTFPLFLLVAHEIFREPFDKEVLKWLIPLLFLFAIVVWHSFFNPDKDILEYREDRVRLIQKELNL